MPTKLCFAPHQTPSSLNTTRNLWKCLAILLLILPVMQTQAAIFTVNAPDGSIADDGLCSISEAIVAANTNALVEDCGTGDSVVPDIIMLENDVVLSEDIYVHPTQGTTGTPAITSAIALAADGYQISSLDTGGLFPGRRLLWIDTGGNLTVKGVRFHDGFANVGGAIYNQGSLSVDNSQFTSNTGELRGGAIYNSGSGTISAITNTTFWRNDAGSTAADIDNAGTITLIEYSTFSGGTGGSIHNSGTINTIQQSTFTVSLFGPVSGSSSSTIGTFSRNIIFGRAPDSCQVEGNPSGTDNLIEEITHDDPTSCPFGGYVGVPTNIDDQIRDNGCAAPFADGSCNMTHAILGGSSAIRQSTSGPIGGKDQRGFDIVGIRDIGAYERRSEDACRTPEQNVDGFAFIVANSGELIDAIECADINGTTNGGDSISLVTNIELDVVIDSAGGNTGTPTISTLLSIDGGGRKISRNAELDCNLNSSQTSDEFRLLRIGSGGDVELRNIELGGGCSDNLGGGGISVDGGTLSLLESSLLTDNQGLEGGAIRIAGTLTTVQNVTFSGNRADTGGAIHVDSGTLTNLRNSTISGNMATSGNSLSVPLSTSISRMDNTIITGSASGHCAIAGGIAGGTSNLVDGGNCGAGVIEDVIHFDSVLRSNNCIAPCLRTHALQPDSNALDGANGFGTPNDQRGFGVDLTRDIGAFEAQRPKITVPTGISIEATGPTSNPVLGNATVFHALESLTATASPSSDFSVGTTSVIWTATDSRGFAATATQSVTITDTTKPVLSGPANITTEATGPTTAIALGIATASDIVDGSITPFADDTGPFAVGTHTITWTATDTAGNSEHATQTVTVTDNGAPMVIAPADITLEATGPTTSVALGLGAANDLVDGTLTPIAANTGPFTIGTHTVTWTATDTAGNSASAVQTVTITDSTAPAVLAPSDITLEATGLTTTVALGQATANDLVDNTLTPTADNSGPFAVGSHSITWSATDTAGNTGTAVQVVTVTDSTAPVVIAPADIITPATGTTTAVSLGAATATDLVDGTLSPSADNAGPFTLGVHTITWSAIDTAGNIGTATQTVSINDATAPVVTPPADISMEASGPTTTVAIGTATVTDDIDTGLLAISDAPASFHVGVTIVTWTATDSSQNMGSATQQITIVDSTPPDMMLVGEASMNLEVGESYIEAGAEATDLVDGDLTASIVITGNINTNLAQTQTLTYSVTDAAGNFSSIDRTVNIGTVRSFSGTLPSGNTGTLTFTTNDAGCSFVSDPQFLDASSAPFEPPPGMVLVDGVLSFVIENCTPGASVQMSMDYGQSLPAGVRHWKSAAPWYEIPSNANGSTITFALVDGGSGDEDSIPGSITDPSAAGTWFITPIPTLSYHMMALMTGALLLMGVSGIRRRREGREFIR